MRFDYYRAKNTDDACKLLSEYQGNMKLIAGGTDLMVQIKEKSSKVKAMNAVLDISFLEEELRYINEDDTHVYIGALATHTDIEESVIIKKYMPFLSEACATVGSPQIRNMGTLGGSICNASPAADPLTPLIADDAQVLIKGLSGKRLVDLTAFYKDKGAVDLKQDELVMGFVVKKNLQKRRTEFIKLGRRKALAISRLNAAISVILTEEGLLEDVRIAPGCIFVIPDRVRRAEEILNGKRPSKELFKQASQLVSDEMIARTGIRWSTEYKKPAIEGLIEEALLKACEMED